MLFFVNEIKSQYPNLKNFIDSTDLYTGAAWQQEHYELLDDSKIIRFIAIMDTSFDSYYPPYIVQWKVEARTLKFQRPLPYIIQ